MGPSIRGLGAAIVALGVLGCGGGGGGTMKVELVSRGDTAFTSASGENRIRLKADVPGSLQPAEVTWQVARGIGTTWTTVKVPAGVTTEIPVSIPTGSTRYKGSHPTTATSKAERLMKQRVRYRVVAVAKGSGKEIRSDTLWVDQGGLAAIRQEYLDIGLRRGAPPSSWFRAVSTLPKGLGYGDFEVAAANPAFMERLAKLEDAWKSGYDLPWQLNSFYRNPAHNRFHVGGSGSGPVSNSWHQFGCAADLQTFPILSGGGSSRADTVRARQFWDALAQEALELDFEVEPRDKNPARPGASYSGVGHVHIEMDCLP